MDGCDERLHATQRSIIIKQITSHPNTMKAVNKENNTQNNEHKKICFILVMERALP
jgi:hypothetical protein